MQGWSSPAHDRARQGGEGVSDLKDYRKIEPEYGLPIDHGPNGELFLSEQKERAGQILKALEGLRICTALCLLDKCKDAVMQSVVDVD